MKKYENAMILFTRIYLKCISHCPGFVYLSLTSLCQSFLFFDDFVCVCVYAFAATKARSMTFTWLQALCPYTPFSPRFMKV